LRLTAKDIDVSILDGGRLVAMSRSLHPCQIGPCIILCIVLSYIALCNICN
jgi:hypothetical protein